MAKKCPTRSEFARKFSILFNSAFVVFGVGIIVSGSYGAIKSDQIDSDGATLLSDSMPIKSFSTAIALTGVGIVLMSLLGLYGLLRHSRKAMTLYTFGMYIMVIAQLMFSFFMFSLDDEDTIDDFLLRKWDQSKTSPEISNQVYQYELWLKCCGFAGAITQPCAGAWMPGTANGQDCRDATVTFLEENIQPAIWPVLILACIEVFGLILGCMVLFEAKDEKETYKDRDIFGEEEY